jgi:NOL1/NOP2/fmu family ribosome biogenesis protein
MEGKTLAIESDSESGYVVVFYRGEVIGCGLYSHGKLVSQIPKERRMASAENCAEESADQNAKDEVGQ